MSIDELKRIVKKRYGLDVRKMIEIKYEPESCLVYQVITEDGNMYALKGLSIPNTKQMFIIQTELLLKQKGIKLAEPMSDKCGNYSFTHETLCFSLYEWIRGSTYSFKRFDDLMILVETASLLHSHSYHLNYPPSIKVHTYMTREKKYDQYMIQLLQWHEKHKHSTRLKEKEITKAVPYFLQIGMQASHYLKENGYRDLMKHSFKNQTLVHGDLHTNNIIVNHNNEIVLIDFENVHYDLPSVDLNRLWRRYMKRHVFKASDFIKMLEKYQRIHPVSAQIEKLMMIDFLFPYNFEHMVRKQRFQQMSLEEVNHLIEQEKQKAKFILKDYFKSGIK
ncbi:phosphotransferase [Bacillus sp. FJAT-47783]|uniref:phosphotransferase n=1 Tax=Bacillus sp. FJAT-47783 TaxID=2922712 RepID=UPI001FAB82F8|nr:phosphotransferase [Bacillus sp. FJAT-47783]